MYLVKVLNLFCIYLNEALEKSVKSHSSSLCSASRGNGYGPVLWLQVVSHGLRNDKNFQKPIVNFNSRSFAPSPFETLSLSLSPSYDFLVYWYREADQEHISRKRDCALLYVLQAQSVKKRDPTKFRLYRGGIFLLEL